MDLWVSVPRRSAAGQKKNCVMTVKRYRPPTSSPSSPSNVCPLRPSTRQPVNPSTRQPVKPVNPRQARQFPLQPVNPSTRQPVNPSFGSHRCRQVRIRSSKHACWVTMHACWLTMMNSVSWRQRCDLERGPSDGLDSNPSTRQARQPVNPSKKSVNPSSPSTPVKSVKSVNPSTRQSVNPSSPSSPSIHVSLGLSGGRYHFTVITQPQGAHSVVRVSHVTHTPQLALSRTFEIGDTAQCIVRKPHHASSGSDLSRSGSMVQNASASSGQ